MEKKAADAQAAFEAEEALRKSVEAAKATLEVEKAELLARLSGEGNIIEDMKDKANKLAAQKGDLEASLAVSSFSFFLTRVIITVRMMLSVF